MYNDAFTPFDDIQCEDMPGEDVYLEEITIPVDFDPDETVHYEEEDDFIPLADDSGDWALEEDGDTVIDFFDDDGAITPAGQDYLAELDAQGAFV